MARQKNKINITVSGPILHGSISTVSMPCGKKNCSCKGDPPMLHGPYYRWTGIIDKKQTTRTISKKTASECGRRIAIYKKLLGKLEKLKHQGLKNAPWISTKK